MFRRPVCWPMSDVAHSSIYSPRREGRSSLHRRWRHMDRSDHWWSAGWPGRWPWLTGSRLPKTTVPVKKTTLNEVSRAREELEAPSQSPLGQGNFLILKEGQAQGKSLPAVQGSSIRVGIHPRRSKQNMSTGNTRGIQFRNKRNYVGMKYLCVQPEQVSSLFFLILLLKCT